MTTKHGRGSGRGNVLYNKNSRRFPVTLDTNVDHKLQQVAAILDVSPSFLASSILEKVLINADIIIDNAEYYKNQNEAEEQTNGKQSN